MTPKPEVISIGIDKMTQGIARAAAVAEQRSVQQLLVHRSNLIFHLNRQTEAVEADGQPDSPSLDIQGSVPPGIITAMDFRSVTWYTMLP